MTSLIVISGSGRYADPWHPFVETSARLAETLAEFGDVSVVDDVDAAFVRLNTEPADLVVVNIGNSDDDAPSLAARVGLAAHLDRGGAVLGVHSAATAFPQWAVWPTVLGGHWVRGTSFHPPQSECTIDVTGGEPFETVDERYTALELQPGVDVIATHEHDGATHPLAWAHRFGTANVGYVGLGHDASAYDSPGARALFGAVAGRLLGIG